MLDLVFRDNAVSDPEHVMDNINVLDKHFKKTYRKLERQGNSEEAQDQLSLLFSSRNTIEYNRDKEMTETPKLTSKMDTVLQIGQKKYNTKLVNVKADSMRIESPMNAVGTAVKVTKGTRVVHSFLTQSSAGFSLDGQVLDTETTSRGAFIDIARMGKPKSLIQRRYKRRDINQVCTFNIVKVEEGAGRGRKKEKKMVVDPRIFKGVIQDISLGGCAMKTQAQVNPGTRLKISFVMEGPAPVAVLGQVLRMNRSGGLNAILHIKFLKVPKKSANIINAAVFEYRDR
jgi:copper chaperone CopZ